MLIVVMFHLFCSESQSGGGFFPYVLHSLCEFSGGLAFYLFKKTCSFIRMSSIIDKERQKACQ